MDPVDEVVLDPSSPDSPPMVMLPDPLVWKEIDLWVHHGGNFVKDENDNLSYKGGEVALLQHYDYERLNARDILNMEWLLNRYTRRKMPIAVFFRDPQFKNMDLGLDEMDDDFGVKYFVSLCQRDGLNELHLYIKHNEEVDQPIFAPPEVAERLRKEEEEEMRRQKEEKKMQAEEEMRRQEEEKKMQVEEEMRRLEEEKKMQEEQEMRRQEQEKKFQEEDEMRREQQEVMNNEFGDWYDWAEAGEDVAATEEGQEGTATPSRRRGKSICKGRSYGSKRENKNRTVRSSYKTKDRYKIKTPLPFNLDDPSSTIGSQSTPVGTSSSTNIAATEEPNSFSDGYTTEELHSGNESEEESDDDIRYPEYDETNGVPVFTLGMEFQNLEAFKAAVREYNIYHGREVEFVKNDKERVRAECIERKATDTKPGCPWAILCSLNRMTHSFQVKTYVSEHFCARRLENMLAIKEWVAQKLVPLVRSNPSMTGQMAFEWMMHNHRLKLHDTMGYRAVQAAHKICEGEEKAQYKRLRDYAGSLLTNNPHSSVKIQVTQNDELERMYICLKACKDGFLEGCRPLIGLDGCFLKGYYGGQLLAAVSQDGNNSFFVIAFAIVEVENTETWRWFVTNLLDSLEDPTGRRFTFISNMQKGLEIALREVCPTSPHRFCCKHIYANFSKKWKGLEFKKAFWSCAKASTAQHFEQAMEVMKRLSPDAVEWLNRHPPQKWSRSGFDTQCKNHSLTSNMCEQFNGAIMKYRGKPIISMLEGVREYITSKMVRSKGGLEKTIGAICQKVQSKLDAMNLQAVQWTPHWAGDAGNSRFEVTCPPQSKCAVDIDGRTCSCREWDLSSIPCQHAIACLRQRCERAEDYVCEWLTKATNVKIYEHFIKPTPGEGFWEKTNLNDVLPPNYKRKPGRPKQKRRKAPEEAEQSNTDPTKLKRRLAPPKCSRCGQLGHNIRSCKGAPTIGEAAGESSEGPSTEAQETTPVAGEGTAPSPAPSPAAFQPGMFIPTPGFASTPVPPHAYQPGMFNPTSGRPVRPAPIRPPTVQPVTRETMQGTSAGTSSSFAAYFEQSRPAQ